MVVSSISFLMICFHFSSVYRFVLHLLLKLETPDGYFCTSHEKPFPSCSTRFLLSYHTFYSSYTN